MTVTASTTTSSAATKDGADSTSTTVKPVRQPLIKIVIRRLPYTMTAEELLEQLAPIPDYEYFYFSKADALMHPWAYSRAYFGFRNDADVLTFRDRFNGYVFVDSKGTESMALVELAPNPKIPKQSADRSKNADSKCGTLEDDPDYKKFINERENPEPIQIASLEQRLKEVEEKSKNRKENEVQETPLVQFLLQKKEDKWRRQVEKKRQREEERKRRLAERAEHERREREQRKKERDRDRDREKDKEKRKEKDHKTNTAGPSAERAERTERAERSERPERAERTERAERSERAERTERPERSERKKPDHQVAPRFAKSKPPTATAYRDDADSVESPSSAPPAKSHPKSTEKAAKPPRFEREDARKAASGEAKPSRSAKHDDGGSSQPRRSKARPERELYQPGQKKRASADSGKKTEKTDTPQE